MLLSFSRCRNRCMPGRKVGWSSRGIQYSKTLVQNHRDTCDIYKECNGCNRCNIAFSRESKECHKGSTQHSSRTDKSSSKARQCSSDTTQKWWRCEGKMRTPERIECKNTSTIPSTILSISVFTEPMSIAPIAAMTLGIQKRKNIRLSQCW